MCSSDLTAEASRTRFAILARAVLADQVLGRRIESSPALLVDQGTQVREGLAPPLTRISATGLPQIAESLLTDAAMVLSCPLLQELMQRIGEIADLERGHRRRSRSTRCISLAIRSEVAAATCSVDDGMQSENDA